MASVFIVRPFGTKPVTVAGDDGKDTKVEVDFDRIDTLLIQEALKKNGLQGETTGVIAQAGNIRLDMFQMLIAYDLVIADISIHNANVFYELGIRHGLRPKGTILIRFPASGADVPFDLKTDRYIEYDRKDPAAKVEVLAASIRETINAVREVEKKPDSPVFLLLPELNAPDPATLVVVPRSFQEAVEKAESDKVKGAAMLALLGAEAKRRNWSREGMRLVGRTQRRIRSHKAALQSWEFVRNDLPDDVEANLQLATVFQRLDDVVSSSQACRRVLHNRSARREDRADAWSQLARNEKAGWIDDFTKIAVEQPRRHQAITDERLYTAFDGYMAGFGEDLNNYYSGINALGLLTAIVQLAEKEPASWAGKFPNQRKAGNALDDYSERLGDLRGAVRMSLDNAKQQSERTGKKDEWLLPSDAQYTLLTADSPAFVKSSYGAVKIAATPGFSLESEARQVDIFRLLDLIPENCKAAFEGLGVDPTQPPPPPQPDAPPSRIIVATGHRVDAADRKQPRFPNEKECIDKARSWLREMLQAEQAETKGAVFGIGGAAGGTDLLFHEVCGELKIETKVVLPIPIEDYRRLSVAAGGADWVEQFNKLMDANPPIILSDSPDLPPWAQSISNYGVFQRGNIFVIADALIRPKANVTVLALWNGRAGDGPGGTADMVALAESHGAKIVRESTDKLFGLTEVHGTEDTPT